MNGAFPSSVPDWANFEVIHRNTLPPRAYFFLHHTQHEALSGITNDNTTENKNGACSLTLSGTWKFHHCSSPLDAPSLGSIDPQDSPWPDIQVPGHWQLQGWGKPHYSNINLLFPENPPNVPYSDNQTGTYARSFTVPPEFQDQKLRLRFEGVDSAFHVYLNGVEIGYSEGARNPSEFDVTSVIHIDGDNTLVVRVYQFSTGSYIEDQDQWRLSGIFRHVFLLAFPAAHIADFHVKTLLSDDYTDAILDVGVSAQGDGPVDLVLLDNHGIPVTAASKPACPDGLATQFTLEVSNPRKWSAEDPQLYYLILSFGDRFIAQNVGFRRIEVKDGILQANGRRIVLRGVNRHEHHPLHGRAVPYEFMRADLLSMKRHNINCIRTSHQPPDPRFCQLADKLGFWVLDEADLECHGFVSVHRSGLSEEEKKTTFRERIDLLYGRAARWTTDNPDWQPRYLDRAEQLFSRDKNAPSVVIWSMGNESFDGCNTRAMSEVIKHRDPTRPIHYEGDRRAKYTDIWSQMYLDPDELVRELKHGIGKPLILCEYAHAMGNGPGNMADYVEAFYSHAQLQGGMIWEWANHGLKTVDSITGQDVYAYGGFFGDQPNDGCFSMDGMCFSDHRPTPALLEYSKAIEPVQVRAVHGQYATIVNRYDLVSLDHLACAAILVGDGYRKDLGTVSIPGGVLPHQEAHICLPQVTLSSHPGELYLQLDFSLLRSSIWADACHIVASSQIQLRAPTVPRLISTLSTPPAIERTSSSLLISTAVSTWTFSLSKGRLVSWLKSGIEHIFGGLGPELGVYRACTNNDERHDGVEWKEKLVHLSRHWMQSVSWHTNAPDASVVVVVKSHVAPPSLSWRMEATTTYTLHADGSMHVECTGCPNEAVDFPSVLPRIGFSFCLPLSMDHVDWFGRGPGESYKDKKLSQMFGNWSSTVSDLFTEYEYPQESANRTDVRWVRFGSSAMAADTGTETLSLRVSFGVQDGFSFMASHYTSQDLDASKYPYQLHAKKKDHVVVRLDADHHGLGSGSCGPKTLEKYALKPAPFSFHMDFQ